VRLKEVAGMGVPKTQKDAKRRAKYVMRPRTHGKAPAEFEEHVTHAKPADWWAGGDDAYVVSHTEAADHPAELPLQGEFAHAGETASPLQQSNSDKAMQEVVTGKVSENAAEVASPDGSSPQQEPPRPRAKRPRRTRAPKAATATPPSDPWGEDDEPQPPVADIEPPARAPARRPRRRAEANPPEQTAPTPEVEKDPWASDSGGEQAVQPVAERPVPKGRPRRKAPSSKAAPRRARAEEPRRSTSMRESVPLEKPRSSQHLAEDMPVF